MAVVLAPTPPILLTGAACMIILPALYAWPLLAFAILLLTVPSFGTLVQIGKLDLRPNDIAIGVGVVTIVLKWVKENRFRLDIRQMDVPVLLIVGWVFVTIFWTPNTALGAFQAVKILFAMLIYFVIVNVIEDKGTLDRALLIWFWVALFWAVVGVYTFYFLSIPAAERHTIVPGTLPHLGKTVRASSFFLDPNDYAFVLSITIMIAVLYYFRTRSSGMKLFSAASIGMMLIVIIGTFSRKSWLGLGLSVFLLGMKKRRIFLTGSILSVCAVAIMMWVGAGKYSEALTNRVASFFLEPAISITERAMAWTVAKKLFLSQPVFGRGVGSFYLLAPQMGSPLNIPHNFYWFILTEFGLVGMLLFITYVSTVVVSLFRVLKKTTDPMKQTYCLIFLSTIPSVIFQSAFKTIGYTEPIFWVFWAFIAAFLRIHGRPDPRTGRPPWERS